MSKAEATAGEWTQSFFGRGMEVIVAGTKPDKIIGIAEHGVGTGIKHAEAVANARLFAASKDLLAACERTLATIEQCPDLRVRLPLLRAELQIAIAKAKGET